MITPDFARMMARYNQWQNRSLLAAAETLTANQRRKQLGAYFGSIEATLNHILWGDQLWMHRFSGTPKPSPTSIDDSTRYFSDWSAYTSERRHFDQVIIDWADALDAEWLDGDLSWYSGAIQADVTKSRRVLVVHMFNHQTHHRGQVHSMLTACDATPDDTDLFILDHNSD